MLRPLAIIAALCLPLAWAGADESKTEQEETYDLTIRDSDPERWAEIRSQRLGHLFRPSPSLSPDLVDAYIAEMKSGRFMALTALWTIDQRLQYNAAILSGNCATAERMLIEEYIAHGAELEPLRRDASLKARWRRQIAKDLFPEAITCVLADEIRMIDEMITWAGLPPHPFKVRSNDDEFDVPGGHTGSIYFERDWRLGLLYDIGSPLDTHYVPAQVVLAELSLSLPTVGLDTDLVYLMLWEAKRTWPESFHVAPPVRKERIDELMAIVEPMLTPEQRAFVDKATAEAAGLGYQ